MDDLSFLTFTLPNYVLAALTYTLLGRILLNFLFKAKPDAVINRVFCQLTDPILHVIRPLTPALVPNGLIPVLGLFWLTGLRMLLFLVTRWLGVGPTGLV